MIHPRPRTARTPAWVGAILLAGVLAASSHAAPGPGYPAPECLVASADGKTLYVAESARSQVAILDPASGALRTTVRLPAPPTGLALSPDGRRLYATCGGPKGVVAVVDPAQGKLLRTWAAGHTPVAPVVTPDGARLCVCVRFEHRVSIFDIAAGKELARIEVPREPIAAVATPDGKTLYVAHLLPMQPADPGPVGAVVSAIDLAAGQLAGEIELPNGSTAVRGLALSADGRQAFVTHSVGRYAMPTTQLERGWMNTAGLTIIDAPARRRVNTVLLDDVDRGAANPGGVAASPDGRWLVVALAGTHELSVIDLPGLLQKLERLAKGERVSDVSATPADAVNDLSFLVGLRRRLPAGGKGPRGVAFAGGLAYAALYFADAVAAVDPDPAHAAAPRLLPLASAPSLTLDKVRWGESLFHDAELCFQQWQSCASCHPDGRTDGLNWDLLNDGIGNPKNTRNMLWTHRTPPAMSLGVRETAETAVRAGLRHILFAVRPEAEAEAIDTYLKSLVPTPSPYLVDGRLSAAARRGEKLFRQAGCADCHPRPLFTDLKAYPVGTGTGRELNDAFDTPTLVEVWRTAPYLHDGRAATLEQVLREFNPGDRHGKTSGLNPDQLRDLAAYVLSL